MGCTTSAPNTLSPNARARGEKSIQIEEDADETYTKHVEATETESENRTEMKVLPSSDTTEPVQLVRNYKSTTSLEPEKDLNTNGHTIESECSDPGETTTEMKDDKMSKLKLEVVGKFIEISLQDMNHDNDVDHVNTDETQVSSEKDNEETEAKMESNENCEEGKSEEADEASPSQSQSSRATRWEALADIAAELPPSLAVDPLTGQIYSLSK